MKGRASGTGAAMQTHTQHSKSWRSSPLSVDLFHLLMLTSSLCSTQPVLAATASFWASAPSPSPSASWSR